LSTRSTAAIRRALFRERPALVVAPTLPLWLRRLPYRSVALEAPRASPDLRSFAELHRFAGQPEDSQLRAAVALADLALNTYAHELCLPPK
jgi:hypothetical protein